MKIELHKITIRDLVKEYVDDKEDGVVGYGGQLDIRPKYQREFIYNEKQRNAVIETINNDFPLNVMYWAVRKDNTYEIIDGQQRTVSICQYANGDFSYNSKFIENLQDDELEKFYDYELMIYLCEGTDSEKLKWFETINIAGEELTKQELRNAVYSGTWITDAKKYFSKKDCIGYKKSSDYIGGRYLRQDLLEIAIKWISNNSIDEYMAKNQNLQNANELWQYFQDVIAWIKSTFKVQRNSMKTVNWGKLYDEYKNEVQNTDKLESRLQELVLDKDVTNESGIYPYVLTNEEKWLSIRTFPKEMKQKVYEKQKGICVKCNGHFEISEMESDHIKPWHEGGKTIEDNCQLLCKKHNREKSGK